MSDATVYLDNDYLIEEDITQPNSTTGEDEAADGLTGLTGHLAATDGGDAIHADVSVNLAERSAKDGRYFGVIDGDALRARVATKAGQSVYVVVGDGTNLYTSQRVPVRATRAPS